MVDFLGYPLRHPPGELLMVWDGLAGHRAGLVGEFIRAQRGRLAIEWLPGYAPELKPGGVSLLLETPPAAQLLSARFRPAQPTRPPRAGAHAPPAHPRNRLLGASRVVLLCDYLKSQSRKIVTVGAPVCCTAPSAACANATTTSIL